MEIDSGESQAMSTSQASTQNKRKRKKNSRCWDSFTLLPIDPDGKSFARCKKCGKEYIYGPNSGTSTLLNHHDTCQGLGISPRSATHSSSFKYEEFCKLIVEAIVKHDLPFNFVEYEGIQAVFDYVSPRLHLPCRNTVKNHVRRMYEVEKTKMKDFLGKAKGRICLTCDLWTSHTTDGYLALTAHFLDNEWNLHKKVLNFCHMPPPHTGNALVEKINSLICEWEIDKNLFSITLDNASANDSFVGKLKTQLNFRKLLLILGIAVVMDPRMKMQFVEWAYKLLYGEGSVELLKFKEILFSLFDAYMIRWSTKISSSAQPKVSCCYPQKVDIFKDFDTSYGEGASSSTKNELISYLEDQRLDRMVKIDVLSWWKNEQFKYPILSRLAGDMLMIPVSTVASESAFSIGGRVLDQYRSSLSSEIVQALLCVRDWIFDKKCTESSALNLIVEDALDLNIDQGNENIDEGNENIDEGNV